MVMQQILEREVLVVKLGGGAGLDLPRACQDLARLASDYALVIVHGVSAQMNQLCNDLNIPIRTIQSPSGHTSRYTDPRTRDIFVRAAREVNQDVLTWLGSYGVQTASLADDPSVAVHGERKQAIRAVIDGRVRIVRDDYSGQISSVDTTEIQSLLDAGIIPVIPPMAMSDDGLLNVDGDRAAAAIAGALGAQSLVILSNVRGLYRDFEDKDSLVQDVSVTQIDRAMDWADGRMKRKVLGAHEALQGGVERVIIGDGRLSDPVTRALNGVGTTFTR